MKEKTQIAIVGAGLCGTLLAVRLSQRGYRVSLYEKRPDLRRVDISAGRSINLALSDRGFKALRLVGMEEKIREEVIPMKARLIHFTDGKTRYSPYSGRSHEYINSVSRGGLNARLLDEAEQYENVDLRFDTSCTDVDLIDGIARFKNTQSGKTLEVEADLIIGADGAGSAVRGSILKRSTRYLFNFSQHFLRHGYKELSFPPAEDGSHRIEKNVLHIWPRKSFMLIALPNLDGSFTVTCFFPYRGDHGFDRLDKKEEVERFFTQHFPDAVPHMPELTTEFFENPTGVLGTVRCFPWQVNGKVLLIGDAAHAIVPFYGQGMNAAFEDVVVLDRFINEHEGNWPLLLDAYQRHRKPDTDAIADLALDNFIEMRDSVADDNFIKKRELEMKLEKTFPDRYNSKYSLVTFNEDVRYSEAMERGRKQDAVLLDIVAGVDTVEELDLREVLGILNFEF